MSITTKLPFPLGEEVYAIIYLDKIDNPKSMYTEEELCNRFIIIKDNIAKYIVDDFTNIKIELTHYSNPVLLKNVTTDINILIDKLKNNIELL